MQQIYVTGGVSDWDDPIGWHRDAEQLFPNQAFINPWTLNNFGADDDGIYDRPHEIVGPAVDKVPDADGMLVKWEDDQNLVGSVIEMWVACQNDIPVVIWYDGWRDNLSPWLLYMSRGNFETLEKSLRVLLMILGEDVL